MPLPLPAVVASVPVLSNGAPPAPEESDPSVRVLGTSAAQLPAGPLERRTDKTITSEAVLRAELAGVRARGYSVTDEELEPGLITVAAPACGLGGGVVAALSVSAPTTRMTRDRLAAAAGHCVAEAAALSGALGYQRAAREPRKAG